MPIQALGLSRTLRLPIFQDNRHTKVVRLSALLTGRLCLQQIPLVLISVWPKKNPSDPIRKGTRDLPTFSSALQPIAPPRTPITW